MNIKVDETKEWSVSLFFMIEREQPTSDYIAKNTLHRFLNGSWPKQIGLKPISKDLSVNTPVPLDNL